MGTRLHRRQHQSRRRTSAGCPAPKPPTCCCPPRTAGCPATGWCGGTSSAAMARTRVTTPSAPIPAPSATSWPRSRWHGTGRHRMRSTRPIRKPGLHRLHVRQRVRRPASSLTGGAPSGRHQSRWHADRGLRRAADAVHAGTGYRIRDPHVIIGAGMTHLGRSAIPIAATDPNLPTPRCHAASAAGTEFRAEPREMRSFRPNGLGARPATGSVLTPRIARARPARHMLPAPPLARCFRSTRIAAIRFGVSPGHGHPRLVSLRPGP